MQVEIASPQPGADASNLFTVYSGDNHFYVYGRVIDPEGMTQVSLEFKDDNSNALNWTVGLVETPDPGYPDLWAFQVIATSSVDYFSVKAIATYDPEPPKPPETVTHEFIQRVEGY